MLLSHTVRAYSTCSTCRTLHGLWTRTDFRCWKKIEIQQRYFLNNFLFSQFKLKKMKTYNMQKEYFRLNGNLFKKKIGNSTLLSFSVQNYFYHYNYVFVSLSLFLLFSVQQIKIFIIFLCVIKTGIKKIENFVAKTSSSKNYFYKIHLIDYPLVAITTTTTLSI